MPVTIFPSDVPLSKRILDLILTSVGLILFLPIVVIITILVLIYHGRPVFFSQKRPGHYGKPFTLYKFRTMTNERNSMGELLSDDIRLTPLGRFLRATSLDEIPELFNVLRGDMSLVGPRPLLMQYLDRYTPEQARRHEVLPGITGWAQIHGRNIISWEDKFAHDLWYVDNWSIWLDMKILVLTLWKVIQREGISQPGHVSAPEFLGGEDKENNT